MKIQNTRYKIQKIFNNQILITKPRRLREFGHWILRFGICLCLVSWLLVISAWAVPQRIVSGMPSITETLYALGLEDQIVGVTSNCNYPKAAQKKPKVGGFFLNLEKIVSLKPDVVIMQKDAQKKDIKRFTKYGLNVYVVDPKSVNGVMDSIQEIGKLCGASKKANQIATKMKQRLKKVEKQTKTYRPQLSDVLQLWNPESKQRKALVIVGFNPLVVCGGGSFIDDILKHAGVSNVAAKTKSAYPQYSFERLVRDNPQYIIIPSDIVTKQEIQKNKRWQSLEAVRSGRILFVDPDILSRPGPRVVDTIEKIAVFVYN